MKETNEKYLFDSNVIIDAITQRPGCAPKSKELFLKAASGELDGYLSSKQITDIYYVLRRYIPENRKRKRFISFLLRAFTVLPIDEAVLKYGLNDNDNDYENELFYGILMDGELTALITNNKKDFDYNTYRVFLPEEVEI